MLHLRAKQWALLLIIGAILVNGGWAVAAQAAQGEVTITVAVPEFSADILNEELLAAFNAENPGIKVVAVTSDTFIPTAAQDLDAHLTATEEYVQAADVLFIDSRQTIISPEATAAGYFLDLSPLASVDTLLNEDDFYPAIWQSFQWDRGIWALPTAADFVVVSYDQEAFDRAGLSYPAPDWTLAQFLDAATQLTVLDTNGGVTTPGMSIVGNAMPAFIRALVGAPLYDDSQYPSAPNFQSPVLEDILNDWAEVNNSGFVGASGAAPINVTMLSQGLLGPRRNRTSQLVSLLPGGTAGILPQGFAISAATLYPDAAYAFARWLTTRTEMASRFSIAAARQSIGVTMGVGGFGGPGGDGPQGGGALSNLSDDQRAIIEDAIYNGLPYSELRYADRIQVAVNTMKTNGIDARSALEEVEAALVTNLAEAVAKKGTVVLQVAPPPAPVELAANEVLIRFGVQSFFMGGASPNEDKWNALIEQFVADDPQVGAITMDTVNRIGNMAGLSTDYDCYYLSDNAVSGGDLSQILNIDPYLAADPDFSKDDVLTGVLDQVTRDNKIWAFPIAIEPSILRYDTLSFDRVGISQPEMTWSVQNFLDALNALHPAPDDPAPFVAENANGGHLLLLIAAYGGLPLDYSTDPVTVNFTDPTVVDAIRQVLDLAKAGLIEYSTLGEILFQRGALAIDSPIYTDVLNAMAFRRPPPNMAAADTDYLPIVYPVGTSLYAISYNLGAGYISALSNVPEAEACYRWLSTVAKHPELFSAMPARRSLIDDPDVATAQGTDLTALYNRVAELMSDPQTVILPSMTAGGGTGIGGFILQRWLFEAFDTYVLNDGDLDEALKTAESYALAYNECVAALPAFDPATEDQRGYMMQFVQCATQVDSRLSEMIGR